MLETDLNGAQKTFFIKRMATEPGIDDILKKAPTLRILSTLLIIQGYERKEVIQTFGEPVANIETYKIMMHSQRKDASV